MDYVNRAGRPFLVPANEDESVGELLPVADVVDPYWQSISLQAAARLTRLAERRATEVENKPIGIDEHLFRRSYTLVIAFAVGTALYAGIMSIFLGDLRSPLPSPDVIAATSTPRR
jgi:hypothetical protein